MSKRDRNKEKQIWTDPKFASELNIIKAKRLIAGEKVSIAKLTKEMIKTDAFQLVKKELEEIKRRKGLKVRFDKKII
jgi:hypothetical protein